MLEDVGPQEFAGVANVVLKSCGWCRSVWTLGASWWMTTFHEDYGSAREGCFAQAFDVALAYIVAGFKAFDGVPSDDDVDDLVEQGLKRAGSVLDANIFE
jgi:hypothetical protein